MIIPAKVYLLHFVGGWTLVSLIHPRIIWQLCTCRVRQAGRALSAGQVKGGKGRRSQVFFLISKDGWRLEKKKIPLLEHEDMVKKECPFLVACGGEGRFQITFLAFSGFPYYVERTSKKKIWGNPTHFKTPKVFFFQERCLPIITERHFFLLHPLPKRKKEDLPNYSCLS